MKCGFLGVCVSPFTDKICFLTSSMDLMIVKHNLFQVTNLWIYTESEVDGVIKDPCKGDSGGPLAVFQGSQPLLIGVLKVKT